jgi:hypothetical protein
VLAALAVWIVPSLIKGDLAFNLSRFFDNPEEANQPSDSTEPNDSESQDSENSLRENASTLGNSSSPSHASSYNVMVQPPFNLNSESQYLQSIIKDVLRIIDSEGYPTESVSMSLVDLESEPCCNYAGHRDRDKDFPASIVKLFWIVMLHGYYEDELVKREIITLDDERKAIQDSDNNASSKIVDVLTGLPSHKEELVSESLNQWIQARLKLNQYFNAAGYNNINITQKTYPIPDLGMPEPLGSELQLRNYQIEKDSKSLPVRNYLSTFDVARLLYEIETGQAISNNASYDIKQLILHDHSPEAWRDNPYNSIEGFLGEDLPDDVTIYTKVGYTQDYGRQEAAIISSQDGKTRYILVVFANDPIFSNEQSKLFPKISRFVYDQMRSIR